MLCCCFCRKYSEMLHLHRGADMNQTQTQLPQVPFTPGTTVSLAGTVTCWLILTFYALLTFMSFHWIWHCLSHWIRALSFPGSYKFSFQPYRALGFLWMWNKDT